MEDLTDDEQLQLAIQMSLEEEAGPPPKRRRITPLRQAKEDSAAEEKEASEVDNETAVSSETGSVMGFLGVDRKAMEQARLARAAKRINSTAPTSTPPEQSRHMTPSPSTALSGVEEGHLTQFSRARTRPNARTEEANGSLLQSTAQGSSALQYPRGVIKRTWASSHDRNNDVRIEDVLRKEQLCKAALSSFQWDNDWLWNKLDLTRTNIMVTMQGKTDHDRREIIEDARAFNPKIRLCFPPMLGQVKCMHSKLMLLFFDDFLRIAVPTANLTRFDWGDDGRLENSVFLIDLPEQTAGLEKPLETVTAFGKELHYFLAQLEAPGSLLEAILRYDFAQTNDMAFIHTVGIDCQHGAAKDRTGLPGLSRAIRQLDLQTETLRLDYASSSLGALKEDFLNAFHAAARGEEVGMTATIDYKNRQAGYRQGFNVYFPSNTTVANSLGGPDAAGAICFRRRWWKDPSFPKSVLKDYRSVRAGLLSHNKIILGRGYRTDITCPAESKHIAWAYVGSHNLSESAWGRVTMDKTRKETKINCKNWECGILIPVEVEDELTEDGLASVDVFRKHLDIPFEYPGQSYAGTEPWFFND